MRASAPGKIFIFGEHAVVYGKRALVTAINLRCFANVKKRNGFRIISPLGTSGLDFERHPYISHAIRRFTKIKDIKGADIRIDSQIPIASGLGSSSAVTVSVLKALDAEYEAGLTDEEIYEIAREVELDVQGIASGTDPFISTHGGCWLIPERKPVKIGDVKFVVIDTGMKSITGEMVRKVAELRQKFPEIVDGIMDVIDRITLTAISEVKLIQGSISKLMHLMFINQALLSAIGVSTKEIDKIVAELNSLGIASKLTGAGGGGCVIGVGEPDRLMKVKDRFKSAFFVNPETEGVRMEHED